MSRHLLNIPYCFSLLENQLVGGAEMVDPRAATTGAYNA